MADTVIDQHVTFTQDATYGRDLTRLLPEVSRHKIPLILPQNDNVIRLYSITFFQITFSPNLPFLGPKVYAYVFAIVIYMKYFE